MAKSQYSQEQMDEALALYLEHGPAEAGRRMGIPSKTISSWANKQGMAADDSLKERNVAAREAALASREAKRERLRTLLLDKAVDLLEDMDRSYEGVTKEGHTYSIQVGPDGKQKLATASAILIDKLRLELGEATERREDIHSVRHEAEALVSKFRDKPQLAVVKETA